jgi:NADH-quinone oxidoreductase subunit F
MAETTIGAEPPVVVLDCAIEHPLAELPAYRAAGGYVQLEKARAMTPQEVTEQLIQSNLRGRGGAFFPTGRKASFIPTPDKVAKPIYLTVNADESEPGTFKDREIMLRVPHRLLEGCLIAARAILSKHVFIYIRGEYAAEFEVLQQAVDDARAAGLFGDVDIIVHRGAGAYICGEETALLDSLEGKRGQPRPRPPFPPIQGLYMAPTQINNVCTIATVPTILEMGAEEFAKTGVPSSPGTAIFSVSGNVVRPGNYELPLGITHLSSRPSAIPPA